MPSVDVTLQRRLRAGGRDLQGVLDPHRASAAAVVVDEGCNGRVVPLDVHHLILLLVVIDVDLEGLPQLLVVFVEQRHKAKSGRTG